MTREAEIRARLEAAQAKDRDNTGPYRATPEVGPDYHKHAAIWGPDGDQLGSAYGNLALGIDGDALAEMWAHAPQDLAWLLGEVERLRGVEDENIELHRKVRRIEITALGMSNKDVVPASVMKTVLLTALGQSDPDPERDALLRGAVTSEWIADVRRLFPHALLILRAVTEIERLWGALNDAKMIAYRAFSKAMDDDLDRSTLRRMGAVSAAIEDLTAQKAVRAALNPKP